MWSRVIDASAAYAVPASAAAMLALMAVVRVARGRGGEIHKRGVMIRNASRKSRRHARRPPGGITIAGSDIAPADEAKHFKIIGSTGTGKSTVIAELLRCALARGDRAVIADPDGGYTGRFYQRYRGDTILNPFESDAHAWDLFAELEHESDIEQLARALIPDCHDASASEWRGYARIFVAALLRGCRGRERKPTVVELWRLLAVAPLEELRPLVAGSPAQPFLDPENARMFGSIRSVTGAALGALDLLRRHRGSPMSVRRWVREADSGCLFIPYRAGQIAALRTIIATWLRLAIFEVMNQPPGRDQRMWFVIDELDALGAVDGLKDALARLRKFGGRCVVGLQSIAQVSTTYGGDAQTIIENCGNTLILRCSASENGGTSAFVSKLIGEREVVRRQLSHGRDRETAWSARGGRRSTNVSEQRVTETAVLSSEIEQLPDLCGYFKSASARAWQFVSFPYPKTSRSAS